jgi:hypothetical protein
MDNERISTLLSVLYVRRVVSDNQVNYKNRENLISFSYVIFLLSRIETDREKYRIQLDQFSSQGWIFAVSSMLGGKSNTA